MNEIDILSAFVSKPRQMKKIKGVMTPVFLKPYDKKFNYTKRFIQFNNILLKQGLTDTIVYDKSLIFNRQNNTFEPKSKYFKKKKLKKQSKKYLEFIDDVVQVNPAIQQLNSQGVLYTYANNFKQNAGTPYHSFMFKLKQIFRGYAGSRILIKAFWQGDSSGNPWEKETFFEIPSDGFNRWFKEEKPWLFFEINSGEYIFDYDANNYTGGPGDASDYGPLPVELQARMRIFVVNNTNPNYYAQAFADSMVSHCVLSPVRDYLEFRIDKAKNKETSTIKKYNAAMNKLINWEMMYPVGKGIPVNQLHEFCCETGFGIDLYLPDCKCEGRKWLSYRPPKEPTKIFKFINTRHNHLDITAQVDNNFRETVTQEEYDTILKDLWDSNDYYVYNEYSIITQSKIYQVESEYNEIVKDFEKVNQLKRFRLNDKNPKQRTLNQFIKASCVYNGCVDFKPTWKYRELNIENMDDLNVLEEYYGTRFYSYWDAKDCADKFYKIYNKNIKESDIKQIDLDKAYTRCKDSPQFCGYPAKITDFRKTDKIVGVGFYKVQCFENLPEFIERLGIYFNNNVYPSPELKYLQKNYGVKFMITCGCWGTTCNIDWGPEKDEDGEWTGMFKKSDGGRVRNYCKWFGCGIKTTEFQTYRYRTDNLKYIENWAYAGGDSEHMDVDIKYTKDYPPGRDPEVECEPQYYNVFMNVPKQTVYHYTHICSFIYGYQRIIMMEQLSKIPIDKIVRVCVDGIYYNDCEFEILKNFNQDKDLKFGNVAGTNYRTNDYNWLDAEHPEIGEPKKYSQYEIYTGAGGCGKTYQNIIDKGNCDTVYIAHSWKLSAAKRDEFKGLDVSVVQRLTMDDWFIDGKPKNYWEAVANKYSTLIVDEISTLSNLSKLIIEKRFNKHKIIYCGDIGFYRGRTVCYQCPPIFNIEGDYNFKIEKKYAHTHLEENRRCDCKKLARLLKCLRTIIENKAYRGYGEITKWIEKSVTVVDKNGIIYEPKDMILSRTHRANEFYDKKYKDLEKYYITEKQYKLSTNVGGKIFGDENIYNGQIFLEKPDIPESKYKIRHGYTIDCIQGETAYCNLIIDINGLNSWQHLYTAISRAKYFKQLIFVK